MGTFPVAVKYSKQTRDCMTPEDKEKTLKREYDLLDFERQARELEKLYNK